MLACLAVLYLAGGDARAADDARSTVMQSFLAEEKVARKRTEIVYSRGDRVTRYVMARVQPNRLHMVVTGAGAPDGETIVIGDQLFQKVDGKWRKSKLPTKSDAIQSATESLFRRFVNVVEGERRRLNGVDVRVFTAQVSLKGSTGMTEGSMEILIDSRTNLPAATSFKGQCGAVPCSFDQSFRYGQDITVEPPVN